MSIYQDEKDMQYMPDSAVEAYKEGKGSKPDEQLLALLEQQKRLGLEADKQAEQNRPMPTVAQQVQQKAGLMDLQKMAQKLGMQITGMAPIGAPVMGAPMPAGPQPVMTPQGQPAPAGIAAVAPQMPGPAMPQAVAQGPAAPRPMAHGGLAAAAPSHMFKFAHGGGVLGFDEGGKADALAAVNAAMPAETPEHTSLTPAEYDRQRQLAIDAVISNFTPPAPRQETYAERDVRMHNQPPLTSYKDPFSISNILNTINPPVPKFERSTLPLTDEDAAAAQAAKAQPVQAAAPTVTPTPNVAPPAPAAPAAPVAKPPGAGLNNIPRTTPTGGDPTKIVQALSASLPGAVANKPATETAAEQKSLAMKTAEKAMAEPDAKVEIQREMDLAKAFGYDTPAGQDAMRRADLMEKQMQEWNKTHAMDKFQSLLTGIVTGGYAGGAPAAQANENAYRENVLKQMELINSIKSPIEQQRRAEAIQHGKNVSENLSKANDVASRTATSLVGDESRAKSAKEVEAMRAASQMAVQQLASATQIKIHQMSQAAADAHRELTPQEIEVALREDPKYKDMTYADRLNAAYGIKTGRSDKMGLSELSQLSKSLGPLATTDADAAEQLKWVTETLKKRYQTENAPPPPKVGDVVRGFRFKGGEPSNQANWEKV